MIRDRVMFGLRSSKIREKLITTESDLTLTEARDIAKLNETSRIQLKTMNEKPEGNSAGNKSELNHIEAKHPHRGRHSEFETCRNRGRRKHIQLQEKCSAIDEVWLEWGEKNHFGRVCEFSASHYGANNYRNHKPKQIQRKISSAKEISKETSRKTKEVIFEYVNWIWWRWLGVWKFFIPVNNQTRCEHHRKVDHDFKSRRHWSTSSYGYMCKMQCSH